MLPKETLKQIQEILTRISNNDFISLEDRCFVQRHADQNQTVANWLKKARRLQQHIEPTDTIELLLNELNLSNSEPDIAPKPEEDLGEWFSGIPSWVRRS